MQTPLQVTFRNMSPSDAVESAIREKAGRLEKFFDGITGLKVVVDAPHQRRRKGKLYHVRVDLIVPGEQIVVSRDPGEHHEYEDVYVAIRDAFDEARRQLEDYVRRRYREWDGTRAKPQRAKVVSLEPERDFGFIETGDGRQVYFHRNSVLHEGFDRLRVGSEVRFAEEAGVEGPQASTVEAVALQRTGS